MKGQTGIIKQTMIAPWSILQSLDYNDVMPEKMKKGVFVRLTETDRKAILRHAKAERRKIADWIRGVLLDELSRRKEAALEQKSEPPPGTESETEE